MPPPILRPWGKLRWVLKNLPQRTWYLLGCFGTEQRSLAALAELHQLKTPKSATLFKIKDTNAFDRTNLTEECLQQRTLEYQQLPAHNASSANLIDIDLLATSFQIRTELKKFLGPDDKDDIILDISSMPKRFFFLIIRYLLLETKIKNLIVVYTIAESYPATGDLYNGLSTNNYLPEFGPPENSSCELGIIGVGFTPHGIKEVIQKYDKCKIHCLFPFPPGPPTYRRNWSFLATLKDTLGADSNFKPIHIDGNNPSDAFEHLTNFTSQGSRSTFLAPYGPKPMSLGMCLYTCAVEKAGKKKVPVFYAQPLAYKPDYSTGVKIVDDVRLIYAYCLRLDEHDYYTL